MAIFGGGEGLPGTDGIQRVTRGIYKGAALQLVDDKLRVAIPASLRNTIISNSPEGDMRVTIAVHPQGDCLVGYDLPWGLTLNERANDRDALHADANGEIDYDYKRRVANGEDLPFDPSGRFIMHGFHKKKAKIGKLAFFYGQWDHFEIWDPATLLAKQASGTMRDNLEYLLEEKGIVL